MYIKGTIQNTVNTSTHITKTPTQLSKHPHIIKPTNTQTHTLQTPYIHTLTHFILLLLLLILLLLLLLLLILFLFHFILYFIQYVFIFPLQDVIKMLLTYPQYEKKLMPSLSTT